ncbi:hypothetical protein [Mycolicibacterium komossense]|uniref:Glycosyltransferase RgtA/B/C/D-like domain-containing protein n=1 Tax=Mycolicibacterium komossense TaxID=1779 RepID=A0ABT3CJK0_9MYCO|nr:hypothetical protein [Mycolicibacterium komossense]MCV7229637.1 hypothetical protein [Mycolicibacterium komossense]
MVADDASFGTDTIGASRMQGGTGQAVWVLLAVQAIAVILQVISVSFAWHGASAFGNVLSCFGLGLTFASAVWALTHTRLDRSLRNAAVVCLGITTALQWRMNDPLLFRGYDEQLHMRTLNDIESSHGLFQPHPILAVSSRYPALESLTALFHEFGLPTMAAATAVVLLARLALVLALCAAVEHVTGSPRAGGLAVAAYSVSPQFVFFNSQFSYQTLSLPLALAAVAFIARARWAQNPVPLFCGATICLLAVAVTHHLTSWLTATFLVIWTLAERHSRSRRRVFCGAVVALLAGVIWAAIQWSLLRDYFGPMIDDVTSQLHGAGNRELFTETSREVKPLWQRGLLVYYAIAVTSAVAWLIFIRIRPILPYLRGTLAARRSGRKRSACPELPATLGGRHGGADDAEWDTLRWGPPTLLLIMVTAIPVLFAARVMPSLGEIGDRASSFLFLPFSLLIAAAGVNYRSGRHTHAERLTSTKKDLRARCATPVRLFAVALATAVFLGGYLLGSGSDWARLPGGYLPGADGRSIDAEALAATRWAHDRLPPGSRIGSDRVTSTLLASGAGLWPIIKDVGPALYREESWGQAQTDTVRDLRLRYLYVDRRIADQPPYVSGYFDERSPPLAITRAALAKFDSVPGIHEVYRHGPVSIYDLSELGIAEQRNGWVGGQTPTIGSPAQVLLGLLLGGVLALLRPSEIGCNSMRFVRSIYKAAGASLTYVCALAALCIASILMLLAGIWVGPMFFISAAVVMLMANPRWAGYLLKSGLARFRWTRFVATATVTLAVGTAIGFSAHEAAMAHQLSSAADTQCRIGACDAFR